MGYTTTQFIAHAKNMTAIQVSDFNDTKSGYCITQYIAGTGTGVDGETMISSAEGYNDTDWATVEGVHKNQSGAWVVIVTSTKAVRPC